MTKFRLSDLHKQMKNNYYNFPNNFKKEGEDHINISLQSETKLGKLLDPGYVKTFNYKFIGKFSSVMSLWYWVRSSDLDDNIRRLTGKQLKAYAESKGIFKEFVPNFKAIIAVATWNKLRRYPYIIKEIKELDPNIKLLSYHVIKSSNLRVCTNYAGLIIEIANELIAAIREDRNPYFDKFADNKSKTDLMYLEGVLSKVLPPEKIEELKNNENQNDVVEDNVEDNTEEDCEFEEPDTSEQENITNNQSSTEKVNT